VASGRITRSVRASVGTRAGHRCEYCRAPAAASGTSFSIDHIMPSARGGTDDPSNLALACQGCNGSKLTATSHRDPVTGQVVPLFNPRIDTWRDHFAWADDGLMIAPLTAVGRATLVRLRLNRPGLILQRLSLRSVGLHPPP
jgi:hypothetical protein